MDEIVGAITGVAMGVIVIAAIYQLSKGKAPLATDITNITTTGLASIFK